MNSYAVFVTVLNKNNGVRFRTVIFFLYFPYNGTFLSKKLLYCQKKKNSILFK